jgi:hypothetical protein
MFLLILRCWSLLFPITRAKLVWPCVELIQCASNVQCVIIYLVPVQAKYKYNSPLESTWKKGKNLNSISMMRTQKWRANYFLLLSLLGMHVYLGYQFDLYNINHILPPSQFIRHARLSRSLI